MDNNNGCCSGVLAVVVTSTLWSPNGDQVVTGVLPSPCFPNFLARTTFVLESLLEAKNPGQDAFFGDFVFNSCNS